MQHSFSNGKRTLKEEDHGDSCLFVSDYDVIVVATCIIVTVGFFVVK